ncbi:MFS transporter [Ideonella sp. DXS22W]|uniref:MFS transporter n=1 Tax=Pseudaquabacterium inlustre TaxID=2984192 RepID=A0ABU9CIB1_9BURK
MSTSAPDPSPPPRRELPGALAPLGGPVFRSLWFTWAAANLTMWMNDVAAAWLMTSLTTSPVMVALVQTASTLPVFVLGLPSGALADILDRRRYYAATQMWVAAVALVLATLSLLGGMTPALLLALTFANGIGLALRWPVFSAIVPSVVTRQELPSALALNGISMNLARVVGPMIAGALLTVMAGGAAVFVLNAVLAVAASWLILRWKSQPQTSALPGERFVGAMRVGVQHVAQNPRMRIVLLRIFTFFLQVASLSALLPLVALRLPGAGPATFTVLLAALGGGAIVAALCFPALRARFGRDAFVRAGTVMHAALSVAVVFAPNLWLALPAMMLLGMAWISTANTLSVAAQMALPDWVRARGMSTYQMALMGGSAAGSMIWGWVASHSSVNTAVVAAAIAGPLFLLATRRLSVEGGAEMDHTPAAVAGVAEAPVIPIEHDEGPVMVTVEYFIDPARADDFARVMQDTRAARRRQGVLSWGLFRDTAVPGRYLEYFVDESWTEHLRRQERFTAADRDLREQRLAFHLRPEVPRVQRYLADRAMR